MKSYWHPRQLLIHKALCTLIVLLIPLVTMAQFKESYTVLDSLLIYQFSADSDSTVSSRSIYETNEHGLSTAYTEYRIDQLSSDWYPDRRTEYGIDPFGRTDSMKEIRSNSSTHELENYSLVAYGFNERDMITSGSYYRWESENNSWYGTEKMCFEFDPYGGLISDSRYTWGMQSGEWHEQGRKTWIRDADGLILEEVNYIWGVAIDDWLQGDKVEYFYDEYRLDTLRKEYGWDDINKEWWIRGIARSERDFDNEGRVIEKRMFYYDPIMDSWSTTGKTLFEYALEGDTIFEESFFWDGENWEPAAKQNRVFDDEKRLLYFENYSWDEMAGIYKGYSKFSRRYNQAGQLTYDETYRWDWQTEAWAGSYIQEYEFNQEGKKLSQKSYAWDMDLDDWTRNYGFYYYYSQLSALEAPQISVTTDSVVRGVPIELICSQDARIYLVPEGTDPGDDLGLLQLGQNDLIGMTPGEISSSAISEDGLYFLYAVNHSGIVSLASRVWITLPAVKVPEQKMSRVKIYPTLVENELYIESDRLHVDIVFYDMQGRVLKRVKMYEQRILVNLSDLAPGTYFVIPELINEEAVMIIKQ